MNRRLLITGGAGFIGSNFLRYMFARHPRDRFIVLDNLTYAGNPDNIPDEIKASGRFEFWYGDVANPEVVERVVSQADVVVHFAAESHVARSIFDNRIFFQTDVLGTQALANAVTKSKQVERFIHISSSEVYGSALTLPMDEEHPLNPWSPYASAKAGADRLVYSYWKTYDTPVVILRPFNQYGPQQHLEKVIPRFITSALQDQPLTIHGSGRARRDWLHVEDLCARLDLVLGAELKLVKGEVINLGSGFDLDILSVANLVLDLLGKPRSMITFIGDRMGQVEHHLSSTAKAERLLGVSPGRPFQEGLAQTIKWYSANRTWWERLVWMKCVPIKTMKGEIEYH